MANRHRILEDPGTLEFRGSRELSGKVLPKTAKFIDTLKTNPLIRPGKLLNITKSLDQQRFLLIAFKKHNLLMKVQQTMVTTVYLRAKPIYECTGAQKVPLTLAWR